MSECLSILMVVLMLVAFAGCDVPVGGDGVTKPPASTQPVATGTDDAAATANLPAGTQSIEPAATTAPGDTATTAPTDTAPAGTATVEPTGTPDASATPKPTSQSNDDADTLTVPAVVGHAKVEEKLTLRKTASSSGTSVAEIPKDGEFTVLQVESGKKWLKVEYDDKTGYVPNKYVSLGESASDRVCTVFCDSAVNVREGAGTSKAVIGTVKSGTNLIVTGKTTVDGKVWYKVSVGSSTGYIIAKYCRIAEN